MYSLKDKEGTKKMPNKQILYYFLSPYSFFMPEP